MEIRQLRSFQTVANLLSFNKAADRLNYAQFSISAQIQALEEELGVQLFDRLGRRVRLTEAGTQLLEYANKILDLVNESHSEMAGAKEPLGSLTIRIPEIAIRIDVEKGEMARVCWADDLETGLLMIHYKDKWCSPAVEAFIDIMRRFVTASTII